MANLITHNNGARNVLTAQLQMKDGYGSFALAAAAQLTSKSPTFIEIDPTAARNLDLPGSAEDVADVEGLVFFVRNIGGAASELITVRDPADATVGVVAPGQLGIFVGSGAQSYALIGILADGASQDDQTVAATIAVADASGGATAAALTLQLAQSQDGATAIASARQVLIVTAAAAFEPEQALNANVTFGSATLGTIAASGSGWALVTTDATGAFACSATNAVDEAVNFWVESMKGGDAVAERCVVSFSNADLATWSA